MTKISKAPAFIKNALSYLQNKCVLGREKIGLRNIIRAQTNTIEYHGLDLPFYMIKPQDRFRLDNFHPGSIFSSAWVDYKGGRADISVTSGQSGWINTPCNISSHFPINNFASKLLQQPSTKWRGHKPSQITVYGDSILITDIRDRWVIRGRWFGRDDCETIDENLTTLRTTICRDETDFFVIYFHETPNEDDLLYLKMRS